MHIPEGTLQDKELTAPSSRPLPMSLIILVALAVHLPLMLMRLPLKSYDAYFHIFFASHYLHHWFNPWNTKWYAGFSQTTYPPLGQQWVAILSIPLGLEFAYMAVELISILLLALGVYRFAKLWVNPRAASFAALASIFLGSEAMLVYSAGQLSTTTAIPIYLNALPYMYEWIHRGKRRSLLYGVVLFTAAAALHHATLIFGSFLFGLPVIALAALDRDRSVQAPGWAVTRRTIGILLIVIATVIIVILPFWIALIHYPVTQTPIPHASRSNFLLSPHWGIHYFIYPYGAMILALPFIFIRGSRVKRLRPLMFGFWAAFLIGLGGTTPVGHIILGRAFRVITMERFSYWATLLALPILGVLISELIGRYRKKAAIPLALAAVFTCGFGVALVVYRSVGLEPFQMKPIAQWLNRGGHDRYRYITLGFGSRLGELGYMTNASSVDGAWNSGRHLPELTKYGGAELTSAKFYGAPGLNSLRLMLRHADRYGLKWIFVRDPYYDPLLYFAGWRHVDNLDRKTVAVWSKAGVPPAEPVTFLKKPPHWQGVMWGTLPMASSILAIILVLIPYRKEAEFEGIEEADRQESLASGKVIS